MFSSSLSLLLQLLLLLRLLLLSLLLFADIESTRPFASELDNDTVGLCAPETVRSKSARFCRRLYSSWYVGEYRGGDAEGFRIARDKCGGFVSRDRAFAQARALTRDRLSVVLSLSL